MSQELIREDVFERKIKLCEDFCYYEEKADVKISLMFLLRGWLFGFIVVTTGMLKKEPKF